MDLRDICTEFNIKLDPIAIQTGFSLPYVGMVVRGQRKNAEIISAVHLAIEKRKAELRLIVN
tara:strand:- start:298 stop:483 length:186 start_codon:yes stop_codon:yes gene_type:complete